MIIQNRNILDINAPSTALTNAEVAGTGVIRWVNPNGFGANYAIQIGKTGLENSEVVLLSSSTPAGTAGTLASNTLYEHPTDTPIYAIKFDQVVFEVSTTGTTGTAAPITNGTVTIQPNSPYTVFDHTTGTTSYAYKTYYKNSATGETTIESDWITYPDYSFYSLAKLRQRVKDRLYDSSFISNDLMIDDWLNEYLTMMNNVMVDVNEDYAIGTTQIAFTGGQELGTFTATDYKGQLKRAWLSDGSGTYIMTRMDSNSFDPARIFNNTNPFYYMQGDTVIGRKPSDSAGTITFEYYKSAPQLVNDYDILPQPMWDYTKGFVDYAEAQALQKDSKYNESLPF